MPANLPPGGKIISYAQPEITPEDVAAVVAVLHSGWLTTGPVVPQFEAAFAAAVGSPDAVAVSSGTAALHLALLALGVQPGQQVLTTPLTFAADANAVLYAGGSPAFVDIDPATYLLDLDLLEARLQQATPGTYAGIICVDYAGYPSQLLQLRALADRYHLWLLQDACHAPGGTYTGADGTLSACGSADLADAVTFSFHPVKHITTGEGGMVTTRRPEVAARVRLLRNHGIEKDLARLGQQPGPWYYEQQALGYNYRLSELHAALGRSQLSRLEAGMQRRESLAARYDAALGGTAFGLPPRPPVGKHGLHLYVLQTAHRAALFAHLQAAGIAPQVHYVPVHLHPFYRGLGWRMGDLPKAEALYERIISLPLYPALTDTQQGYVIDQLLTFRP
jgi:UDP-4-amino-4,6-dideoxy-N-acetyl-beta-L-altrosamine transaminase